MRAPPLFHLPRRAVFERRRRRAAEPLLLSAPPLAAAGIATSLTVSSSPSKRGLPWPVTVGLPVAVSFDAKTIRKTSLFATGLCRYEVREEAWEIHVLGFGGSGVALFFLCFLLCCLNRANTFFFVLVVVFIIDQDLGACRLLFGRATYNA